MENVSKQEQAKVYAAAYGSHTQRLMERQLEALRWLEALVAAPPRVGDSVAAWLNPALAKKLEATDVFTLHQLIERVNGLGQGWFTSICGIGATKAQRIVQWLRAHKDAIAQRIGAYVALPRSKLSQRALQGVVEAATEIRPREKIIVPAELDGSQGLYRRQQAQYLLSAGNDYEAILAWIGAKHSLTPEQQRAAGTPKALSHTQHAYRKEAKRFLLWPSWCEQGAVVDDA
jgi:hypothetical protein